MYSPQFLSKYLPISARSTGETSFFSYMSKDPIEFPCNYREDVFAEGCLDAPEDIPTGRIFVAGRSTASGRLMMQVDSTSR